MKFVFDWCVLAYPENQSPPPVKNACYDVCAGPDNSAKLSLTDRLFDTNTTLQYQYCDGPNIMNNLNDCLTCMSTVPDTQVLRQCKFQILSICSR